MALYENRRENVDTPRGKETFQEEKETNRYDLDLRKGSMTPYRKPRLNPRILIEDLTDKIIDAWRDFKRRRSNAN